MCGRFVSSSTPEEIAEYFGAMGFVAPDPPSDAATVAPTPEPNFNVAPTTGVMVVVETRTEPERHLDVFRWGLVPRWANDVSIGNRMINARAETIATKNAFKGALARRRCIIPADGFYEWQIVSSDSTGPPATGKKSAKPVKQPVFIHRGDGDLLAFAGLWETWKPKDGADTDGQVLRSCTIVTCGANATIAPVHDRMPVILPPDAWGRWLDPELTDVEALQALLVPAPDALLTFHPVSTDVNNPRNKSPHLIEAVDVSSGHHRAMALFDERPA